MSLKRQEASSLVDILERTPPIPPGSQWGMFLRNHDELTLEMVTAEERAYMYEQYAPDPAMKKNLGIRRRLAPLLDGDRRRIELLDGLLLSLPGSPVFYYGDEIGMGDEYRLEDRDGVRTPMQWDGSPGVGFSTAPQDELYLPVVMAPGYTPTDVNVAAQRDNPDSLLTWVRQLLELRRSHPVFGVGSYKPVATSDPAVFAILRRSPDETVLVVANVSERSVETNLDLPATATYTSVRGSRRIDEGTAGLAPYEFDWLCAER